MKTHDLSRWSLAPRAGDPDLAGGGGRSLPRAGTAKPPGAARLRHPAAGGRRPRPGGRGRRRAGAAQDLRPRRQGHRLLRRPGRDKNDIAEVRREGAPEDGRVLRCRRPAARRADRRRRRLADARAARPEGREVAVRRPGRASEEILARRIGGNELDAISTPCAATSRPRRNMPRSCTTESPMHQYAQKWLSTPGKQDGLSWYDADGKPAGPIGDEIAKAARRGLHEQSGAVQRLLLPHADGPGSRGAAGRPELHRQGHDDRRLRRDRLAGDTTVSRASRPSIVNNDGVVYQKDLGRDTAKIAPGIKPSTRTRAGRSPKDAE